MPPKAAITRKQAPSKKLTTIAVTFFYFISVYIKKN